MSKRTYASARVRATETSATVENDVGAIAHESTPSEVILAVPGVCPSVNALLSGKIRDRIQLKGIWQVRTAATWINAGSPRFTGPVVLEVRLYFPTRRKRDWPNFMAGGVKVAVDTLVELRCLIGDDDDVLDMNRPQMLMDRNNPRVELRISQREEATDAR